MNKSYADLTQKMEPLAKSHDKFASKPEGDKEPTVEGRPKQIYSSAVEILDSKAKHDDKLQIPSNTQGGIAAEQRAQHLLAEANAY